MLDDIVAAAKTGAHVVKASDEVVAAFFKTIDYGIETMKGGDKTVNKFIDNVFDTLKKQVDEATMSLDDFEYFWRGSRHHWAQVKL